MIVSRLERVPLMLSLAFTVLGGGCTFEPSYDGTRYTCTSNGQCPPGFGCVADRCVAGVPDSGPCGTMKVAAHDFAAIDFDDFDSTSIWDYSDDSGATIETVDGQLVFEVLDAEEDLGSSFKLDRIFPRSGSELTIEVIERSPDGTSGAYMLIEDREGDHIEFYEEAGTLHTVLHTSVDELAITQIPYDPALHRFWRIHEEAGLFVFSTSPDGTDWTQQATSDGANVDGWLGAEVGLWKLATGGGLARFVVDNFNGGGSAESFCPSVALQDDFDDGVRSDNWQFRDSNDCIIEERDGRLGYLFPNTGEAECAYRSNTRYDIRASTASIEAPLIDTTNLEHCFELRFPGRQNVQFELLDGSLYGTKSLTDDSGTLFSVEFDPDAHRFWRYRGQGDTLFWELSADGRAWQVMSSQQKSGWDLSQVTIDLVGDNDDGVLVENLGQGFDNYNIVPTR